MKIKTLLITILGLTFLFSCEPKNPNQPKKVVNNNQDVDVEPEDPDKVEEKGTPPSLPGWVKVPIKKSAMSTIVSKVKVISLEIAEGLRVKIRPPYKILQIGQMKDTPEGVIMPVRVERDKYWLRGTLDMFQINVTLSGGVNLYDAPKGTLSGFVSSPIPIQVKKVNGNWVLISHELNAKCSPLYVKAWVKKSDLLKKVQSNVKFPAKFNGKAYKRVLKNDAPLFEVYGRRRGGDMILQLPLCNDSDQVLMVPTKVYGKKGRARVFFKPSKLGKIAILGWMDKEIAQGMTKGTCTCRTNMPQRKNYGLSAIERDYKVRTTLPLYITPNKKEAPIGFITPSEIIKVNKYYKDGNFAVIEIENGIKLYTPYHVDYFFP
jgi:hypothetical protein